MDWQRHEVSHLSVLLVYCSVHLVCQVFIATYSAVGTLPLIHSLHKPGHWTQLWYADDASAGGTLLELRD